MDQHQNQNVEQEQQQEQEKKPMNGSAGKNSHNNNNSNHANGKCTSEEKPVANGNGVHQENNNHKSQEANSLATPEDAFLPHLESIERLMKLPVVEATWHQSQDVYGKVKGNLRLHAPKRSQLALCAVFRFRPNYQFQVMDSTVQLGRFSPVQSPLPPCVGAGAGAATAACPSEAAANKKLAINQSTRCFSRSTLWHHFSAISLIRRAAAVHVECTAGLLAPSVRSSS